MIKFSKKKTKNKKNTKHLKLVFDVAAISAAMRCGSASYFECMIGEEHSIFLVGVLKVHLLKL